MIKGLIKRKMKKYLQEVRDNICDTNNFIKINQKEDNSQHYMKYRSYHWDRSYKEDYSKINYKITDLVII